jgi:hypothetical protein
MKKRQAFFWKTQTHWVRRPAAIEMRRHDDGVGIGIWAERLATEPPKALPSLIFLSPQEAMAVAAWLSEAAEHLTAKAARAAARKAARLAAKAAKGEQS